MKKKIQYDWKYLCRVGCAAAVVQVTGSRWPRPSYSLLVTGLARVTLDRVVQESPFPVGEVTQIEVPLMDAEGPLQSRMVTFKEKAMELLELLEGSRPAVRRIKVGKMQGCDQIFRGCWTACQPISWLTLLPLWSKLPMWRSWTYLTQYP